MHSKRVRIDFQFGKCKTKARNFGCGISQDQQAILSEYVDKERPAAILNLNRGYNVYIKDCLRLHKKSLSRSIKLAKAPGYVIYRFFPEQWVDDLYEINTNVPVRPGGAMRPLYLRKPDELAEVYRQEPGPSDEQCPKHWRRWYGCFLAESAGLEKDEGNAAAEHGHGEKDSAGDHPTTHSRHKLVAYASIRRLGNFCSYSLLLGHRDSLVHGVMYRLHFHILRRLLDKNQPATQGIEFLMHGGFLDGNKGLRKWKKRLLFYPGRLVLKYKMNGTGV